jgi:hypothetical protein
MHALLPLSWIELRQELWHAYKRAITHLTIELAEGATVEVFSPRIGAKPSAENLEGCRILIARPLIEDQDT